MPPNAFSLLPQVYSITTYSLPLISHSATSFRYLVYIPSSPTHKKYPSYLRFLGTVFWHGHQETDCRSLKSENLSNVFLVTCKRQSRPRAVRRGCCPLPLPAVSRLTLHVKCQWGSEYLFPKGSRKQLIRFDNLANLVPWRSSKSCSSGIKRTSYSNAPVFLHSFCSQSSTASLTPSSILISQPLSLWTIHPSP